MFEQSGPLARTCGRLHALDRAWTLDAGARGGRRAARVHLLARRRRCTLQEFELFETTYNDI